MDNSLTDERRVISTKSLLTLSCISGILFALSGMDFIGYFIYIISDSATRGIYTRNLVNVLGGFLGTSLSLFAIPLYYIKIYRKQRLSDYGTTPGIQKFGIFSVSFFLITIPLLYFGSQDQNLINNYPLTKDVLGSWPLFVGYELLYITFYYIPYEFFFRGILQLGLSKQWKKWQSILFVTAITTFLHLTKPFPEIVAAAIAGTFFGILAEKTGSWYYVFLMHITAGISTDIFCGLRFLGII